MSMTTAHAGPGDYPPELDEQEREERLYDQAEDEARDIIERGDASALLRLMGGMWAAEIALDLAAEMDGGVWQEIVDAVAYRMREEAGDPEGI